MIGEDAERMIGEIFALKKYGGDFDLFIKRYAPLLFGALDISLSEAKSIVAHEIAEISDALRHAQEERQAMKPVRIQRKRIKGFNLKAASPNGLPVVSVTRPGKWGNPFGGPAIDAIEDYRLWILGHLLSSNAGPRPSIRKLRGKNLACWCPLTRNGNYYPCHADVLLELANKKFTP